MILTFLYIIFTLCMKTNDLSNALLTSSYAGSVIGLKMKNDITLAFKGQEHSSCVLIKEHSNNKYH